MSGSSNESGRRGPKGDKRQRTRRALMEAARELIRERGYERTTLQAVAERAGMTSGAIYGNFKNRDDLFMALADIYWAPIKPVIRKGTTFAEKMRAISDATVAAIPDREAAAFGRLSGMAWALGQEDVRARIADVTRHSFHAGAEWLQAVADDGGLPMRADLLVVVIHSLTEGLLFQRFLTPELVPDEVFHAAFAALAGERTA